MATYSGEIDEYFVNVLSPNLFNGKRLMNVMGNFGTGVLWFHPMGAPLPDNKKYSGKNVFVLHYHMDSWDVIIDVLRNESPVYFNYSSTYNSAQIHTGNEPVRKEDFF